MKSSRFSLQCCCILIFGTSLLYLSIIPLGSFDVNMHSISGVFNAFGVWFVATLLHLNRKLWNRLNSIASPSLIGCQFFTSFWYDASILCGFPYTFSNRNFVCLNSSLDGSWMQCLISSLASPLVYLISFVSFPLGSSTLLSATSLNKAIK